MALLPLVVYQPATGPIGTMVKVVTGVSNPVGLQPRLTQTTRMNPEKSNIMSRIAFEYAVPRGARTFTDTPLFDTIRLEMSFTALQLNSNISTIPSDMLDTLISFLQDPGNRAKFLSGNLLGEPQ